MICVADHYVCELSSELSVNLSYIESVAVKITHQSKRIIASTVYRTPNSNFYSFSSFVESHFRFRKYSTSDYVLCVDFNFNLLNLHDLENDAFMFFQKYAD